MPWYIKKRITPQMGVYYVPVGKKTKAAAKQMEKTIHGENFMLEFATEDEYVDAVATLRRDGEWVI